MKHSEAPSVKHPKWRKLQWVVVPLVVVLVVEAGASFAISSYNGWYSVNTRRPPDMIVIGSSRVEAGVDARQLSEQLSERAGTDIQVSNQARGGSTIVEHYLALRDLLPSFPADDRDVLVGLEAPGGVPANLMRTTWSDPWAAPDYLSLLPRFLTASDLDNYWSADQALGDEMRVTMQWGLSASDLALYREQFRDRFFAQGSRVTTDVLKQLSPSAVDPSIAGKAGRSPSTDLSASRRQPARSGDDASSAQCVDDLIRSRFW